MPTARKKRMLSTTIPTEPSQPEVGNLRCSERQKNMKSTRKRGRDENSAPKRSTLETKQPSRRVKRSAGDEAAINIEEGRNEAIAKERLELCKALYRLVLAPYSPDYANDPEQDDMFRSMFRMLESLEQRYDDAGKATFHRELLDGTFVLPVSEEPEGEELDDWDFYPDRGSSAEVYEEMPLTEEELEWERVNFPFSHLEYDYNRHVYVDRVTGLVCDDPWA